MIVKIIVIYKDFDKRYYFFNLKDIRQIKQYSNMFNVMTRGDVCDLSFNEDEMKDILDIKIEFIKGEI